MVDDLISCGIEDYTFGPTMVRDHFPGEELTLPKNINRLLGKKNRLLEVASLVE